MAKRNRDKDAGEGEGEGEGTGETAENTKPLDPLPEGFEAVGSSGPQKWVTKEEGVTVRGRLIRRFEKPKSKRSKGGAAYEIQLTSGEVPITLSGESDIAQVGDIVCIDETKAIEDLRIKWIPLVERGGKVEAFIKYLEEIDLDGGNTFWRTQCGAKLVEPPPAPVDGSTVKF